MPDEALDRIDQLSVEFHWEEDPRFGWAHDERYLKARNNASLPDCQAGAR